MDYDDNDFQGQNLHLAGEGSSKNSTVLPPYALAKFDFDDGLQGHLRFDSLVENEVFLGIPSQEDHHWIEDFSRGSSGIEFSSRAAEPCSITRHNNVWSEATSSESVEMLLKSVGQEEIVHEETILEESDAFHELGSLTEQMEPHMKQDEKVMDVVDSESTLSRPNDVKSMSQTQEAEIPTHGNSHLLDPNASCETCGVENNPGVNKKSDSEIKIEVNTSVNEYSNNRVEKDSSGSGMQNDDIASSSQGNAVSDEVLNNQESDNQVSDVRFGNASCLLTDTGKAAGEHHVLSKDVDKIDQILKGTACETGTHNLDNLPASSKVEPVEQQTVETGISSFDKPSRFPLMAGCNLQIVEGCDEDLCTKDLDKGSKCEHVDLSNSSVIHQQLRGNMHEDLPVVFRGDSNLEGRAIEISNIKAGISAGSELKMDQATSGENSSVDGKGHLLGSRHQLDSQASVSNSEASLLPGVDSKVFDDQGDGSNSNYVGDHPSVTVTCSSTDFHGQKLTTENLDGVDVASGVHTDDLNAGDHVSFATVAGSMRSHEGNLVSDANEVHYDQDVSFDEQEKAKLPNDSVTMALEMVESLSSDKKVEPSSQGEAMKVGNVIFQGSECDTTGRNEPGATEDRIADHLDKNKMNADEGSTERASKLGPVLGMEKGVLHNSAEELPHKAVYQSLPALKSCSLASGSEQAGKSLHKAIGQSSSIIDPSTVASQSDHAVKGSEISGNSFGKLEVCPTICDSTVKEDGGPEGLIVPGIHEEAALGKNLEVASSIVAGGGASADSAELSCGAPNIISCTVLSQSEKDKKGGVCESMCSSGIPQNIRRNDATKDEGSFTFQVHPSAGLPESETSKDAQSFPTIQSCNVSMVVNGSPSAPVVCQMDPKTIPELSPGSSQAPDWEIAHGGSKDTTERKTRRASGKATGKEKAKKGNVKETTPSKQSGRGVKSRGVSMSLSDTSQLAQFEGLKPHGNVESGAVSIPTSSFLDLKTAAPPSALFQQPFTDSQQVQLRAQIFVYGSMIQGATPDEACMVSAFGASDGGRSFWEPVWRASVERLRGQKSHPKKSENPVQPRSGAKPLDQPTKPGSLQSKVLPSPLGQTSSKATPSPVLSTTGPLSSPLWTISTPSCDGLKSSGMPRSGLPDYHQIQSPLHSLQTSPMRSFVGLNTSWLSQAPFPGTWVASPQTPVFDATARFSALPIKETVKLTSVKESSAPLFSGTKHPSHGTVVHSTGPSIFAGTPPLPDMKKVIASSGQNSTDTKSRKRKKVTVSEDRSQLSLFAHTRTESVCVPLVTSHLSTSVVVSTPACFASEGNASKIITTVPPTFPTAPPKSGEQKAEQKATYSGDSINKVEETMRQAEDAAALAAVAVNHSQNLWSQLDKQKSSGLIPDVAVKLASAAAAIAAAASVAKAAAAAANIASNAALQAKLMADEALISTVTSNPTQSNAAAFSDVMNLGKATPASILKGGDGSSSSSSIIFAAREAARRRVEAASAASKHAENLDAIVKAAELAAEAVSQAGKIVAMGNPLPLNELVEAGPDNYRRVPQVPPEQGDGNRVCSKVGSIEGLNGSGRHAKEGLLEEEANTTSHDQLPLAREFSRESLDPMRAADGVSTSFTGGEKDSRGQRSRRASDSAKTIGVIPESEFGSRSVSVTAQDKNEKRVGTLKENNIKEGCFVEVYKDGDEFKIAWYSANVLSLKDGKAFVVYSDLQSDNGSRELKEWVALDGEGNNAPRIRIGHRVTSMRSEGTRKRRRAARGDYAWSVGDRVDTWIQDCWREGVVTDKNKDDATLTVHFPAEGERSVVKAWDLRPTLVWKDGEWIEWSSSLRDPSSQGDTPQEKRLKLGSSAIEGREKDSISKNIDLVESRKPAESGLLPLSANEKKFNVGMTTTTGIKPDTLGKARSGLQKEGSRVIFGVPKPGKKRKFMDVSKHYVAERSRTPNEPHDSIKLANYLMPQGSGPRGWRNTKFDAKAKQPAESKPKVLKAGKLQSVLGRSLSQTDNSLTSGLSAQNEGAGTDHVIEDSVSTDKNESGQQNDMEFGSVSSSDGAAKGPVLCSSLAVPSHAPSKKLLTSNAKSERVNKGKLAPSTGKVGRVEVKDKLSKGNPGKSILDVAEPRRSNRRIQPTSRLLEGLQSSLMISKIPAVSHDKGHRSQTKGTSKGSS